MGSELELCLFLLTALLVRCAVESSQIPEVLILEKMLPHQCLKDVNGGWEVLGAQK